MNKSHYYLSNGLWKIVQCYFDYTKKLENDYFWGMAVQPNCNSFGSHIISTPWQQSWATMDILEASYRSMDTNETTDDLLGTTEMHVLRKEVDFQYTLRNYTSDSFVQQLFSIYSRMQTHLLINYSEAETKAITSKLKVLLKSLLKENPSAAHTLLIQILQHSYFISCCETLLTESEDVTEESQNHLFGLLLLGFSHCGTLQFHVPVVTALSQTPFRYQLCLLLLASDSIPLMLSFIDEDKNIFQNSSSARLKELIETGLQPNQLFFDMILMGEHFLFQILNLIKMNIEKFPQLLKCQNIPSFVWPIVLLQCWNKELINDDILLHLIDKCKESTRDKTIMQITFILEWYINFCKWYQQHGMSEHKTIEKEQNLLDKAKEHSVLYLINNSTDLTLTDWNQIQELLKQGKSGNDDLKSWDIILFDGYCILMLVLRTILSSTEIDQVAKSQKAKMLDIGYLNTVFQSFYNDEVTERLKSVKKIIKTLYPLNFRLEILENIFSLIFVQFEDVKGLSYYVAGTIDSVKGLEKVNVRSKSVPVESSENSKFGRSYSLPPTQGSVNEKDDENASKKPTNNKHKGFICKKYVVRDLLYLVKECLEDLEKDPRSQVEKAQMNVPCSIKSTQMENRLDRLTESVSEATWRLQLVTDPDFVSQKGIMKYACGQDPYHHFDAEWIYLPYEHDRSGLIKARKKSSAEKTNDSGSQSQSSPGNGSGEVQNVKHKVAGPSIMSQMLACDSSMVVHCLSQGDVLNADHIIQLMSTEENRQTLEGELHFTESINDLKKKLQNISLESPIRRIDPVAKSRSLQSIQLVANQGVTSTALTNHVERFLSGSTLPSIQGSSKVTVGSMLQCIENAHAIVAIDLALTTAMTFQDFKDLLNIASKHCPELSTRIQSPISPQTTFSKPLGYIVFSQNMIALLQEANKSHIDESDSEVSLQQFLRSHQCPFALKSLKDNINFWKHMKLASLDFQQNAVDSAGLIINKEGMIGKCQKNIKDMQKILESVTKLTEGCSEFMDLGRTDISAGEIQKPVNYCDLLSKYLTDLSTLILDNLSSKAEDIDEAVTFHALLEQSAVDIVDKLIFYHHIEPGVLEKKAQQLGFNLSASLVAGCCPRLPQVICSSESSKCPTSDRIVLNELVPNYKSLEQVDAVAVVGSILNELLIAFRNYLKNKQVDASSQEFNRNSLNDSDIVELRNDFKIQRILEKTLELNFVQVKTLRGSESFVFFTNLLNLMMCHCYLSSKLEAVDGVYSKYSLYRDVSFVFLGYNVGELGFVSISDVRTLILGEEIRCPFSIRRVLCPVQTDSRVVFAMPNFRPDSPRLQLYSVPGIDEQLERAVLLYVQNSVYIEEDRLYVTELLQRYLQEVLLNQEPESQSDSGSLKEKTKLLLNFLIEHSTGELKTQLTSSMVLDLSLEVYSGGEETILLLDYSTRSDRQSKSKELSTEKWVNRTLSDPILRHLSQSSRVLADIVQKIHEAKEPPQTEVARDVLTEEKLKYLDLYLNSPWLQHVAPLFNGNPVITALNKCPQEEQLIDFFRSCIMQREWKKCLDVLFALPDYCVFNDMNLKRLKDIVLCEMTLSALAGDSGTWYYSQHISDVNMQLETVKTCLEYWPGPECVSQLSSILRDNLSLPQNTRQEIRDSIRKVLVYHAMTESCPELKKMSWFEVSSIASFSPHIIISSLVKANQLELCLRWTSLPNVLSSIQQFIDFDFILLLLNHLPQDFALIDQLLTSLPGSNLSQLCNEVIPHLKSIASIRHITQLALQVDPSPQYHLVVVGVDMLSALDLDEQSHLFHLVSSPLLIIEQLLMNTRLDALERVLKRIREVTDTELINQCQVNELVTLYASKAVEFDFVKAVKSSENKQSFLLDTLIQSNQEFTVPTEVPDKSQWVPDNQVSLCMCCLLVAFSMFNRRHHCRRCGRVVCGACSSHRMKVQGYRGVSVRVCQHCYLNQSKPEGDMRCSQSVDTFDSSSFTQEFQYWKLSIDPSRNATVREEFSFEHSPNVPLCLSIINLLPDATFASLLLDESEKLLQILQLNGKSGNPEVDCGVMIQIIRSLILGAKVKYGQAGLTTGVVCCDRLLSQVDLLHLLIKNHCSRLIPAEPLNASALRHLRDKLVEEELWDFAMEVSTKCGLDRGGVWASWGKVCLASGCWDDARIKFSHCLEAVPKPARNPPLIDEICQILENATSSVNLRSAQKLHDEPIVAQEVAQVLSTLKALSQGKSLPTSAITCKNSVQYEEQVFYLTTYGSHQGLLSFYLKHEEWKLALTYLLQQHLDSEVFLESLLLPSYRSDQQDRLKTEMLALDPSLELFKKYLCSACVQLKKFGYLNTLYDVQLLMQDFVRAAVTCIHLYQRDAKSYSELMARANFLHAAQRHLEEEISAIHKKTKRITHAMKMEPLEINKHMNTIWRQLEAAKFLGACEAQGKPVLELFPDQLQNELPTLFDGNPQRILLATLIVLSGKNVPEGFGVAFRIMQDHQLDQNEVYMNIGNKLAELKRVNDIEALIDCIKTSGAGDATTTCDQVLSSSITLLSQSQSSSGSQDVDRLVKLIVNVDLKISALIDSRQLKSAYLLAVKHNRLKDVQRVMEAAEQLGQTVIKNICMKRLGQSPEGSICSSIPSTDST